MSKTGKTGRGRIAARLAERLDELSGAMIERLWDDPELADVTAPERRGPSEEIARTNLAHEIEALRAGRLPVSCPPQAAAAARAAVAFGAPLTVVLQCYRAGHAVLWDAWLDAVDELAGDREERRRLLHEGARFMFDYADRCAAWVEREYSAELERVLRAGEQRRVQAVRDLLAGSDAAPEVLGYDLDAVHLAAVAAGAGAERAVRDLGKASGLALHASGGMWWGWWPAAQLGIGGYVPPDDTAVGIGGPAAGVDGFRRAHAEAGRALAVARRAEPAVASYADVALEALALADESHAHAFAERELGPLLADGAQAARLRDTLFAYFRAGQNATATAARLGIHERTVANRLRAVERVLGHHPATRRAELELALRLHRRGAPLRFALPGE